jgi:hypothetical protein
MCSKLLHAVICAIGLAALMGNPTTVSACGLRFRHAGRSYYVYTEYSPVGYWSFSQPVVAVESQPTIAYSEGPKNGVAPAAVSTTQTPRSTVTVPVQPTERRVLPLSAMGTDRFPSPIAMAR